MSVPQLIAERFTLRPLRETDVPEITAACQDPEILRWCMGAPLGYTEENAIVLSLSAMQPLKMATNLSGE
mgnify:CR=1 FL=1